LHDRTGLQGSRLAGFFLAAFFFIASATVGTRFEAPSDRTHSMPTPEPLQRFVDDALTHAPRWLGDVSQDALQALLDGHNPALVSQPREAVGHAVSALQGASRRLIDGFVIELRVRIDEAVSDARGHAARTLGNDIDS